MEELNEIHSKNESRKAACTSRRTNFSSKNKDIVNPPATNKGKEVEKDNQEVVVEKKT